MFTYPAFLLKDLLTLAQEAEPVWLTAYREPELSTVTRSGVPPIAVLLSAGSSATAASGLTGASECWVAGGLVGIATARSASERSNEVESALHAINPKFPTR
jgi:hypothetical protein